MGSRRNEMAEFNYNVLEEMHQSKIWNNHILKVSVKGTDKLLSLIHI